MCAYIYTQAVDTDSSVGKTGIGGAELGGAGKERGAWGASVRVNNKNAKSREENTTTKHEDASSLIPVVF